MHAALKYCLLQKWYRKFFPNGCYLLYQMRWWVRLFLSGEWSRCKTLGWAILVRAYDNISLMIHNANSVECPVCGWQGNRFYVLTNLGYSLWPETLCPRCGTLDRHRALFLYLKAEYDLRDVITILDIAPTAGIFRKFSQLSPLIYVGVDRNMVCSGEKMHMATSVTEMSFKANIFDLLLCFHVLEHVQHDGKAIAEIKRVLKPGGVAIIDVPYNQRDISRTVVFEELDEYGHYRTYGTDFLMKIQEAGFYVKWEDPLHTVGKNIRKRYGLPTYKFIFARLT
jgi:SAM-dependent methyltransferase